MLPVQDKATYTKAWNDQVELLGVDASLNNAGNDYPVKIGFQKPKDAQLINDYSEEARIATIRAQDIPGVTPLKFDVLSVFGIDMALQEVHEVRINDNLLGWRCICRG